jgi:hypothetical protein
MDTLDLETIFGGQAATPTPTPTPTPSPTVPDRDWNAEWAEQMKKPASWSSCTGGFWHGCTEGDRYR